jgi:outer membrane immunogenic protein
MTFKSGLSALIAAAVIGVSANAASAADMSRPVYKAAPMVAPGFNWTGFYLGAVGGYAWGEANASPTGVLGAIPAVTNMRSKPDGWLAGGTIGYNYQQGNLVLGTEGEFYWSDLEGSTSNDLLSLTATYSNNWTGTLSTRLGVAFDTLLVYSKAGVAWANNDYNMAVAPAGFSSTVSDTETGWLVGGGVEWAFARNWSAKIEGTYMDFGQKNKTFAAIGGVIPVSADIDAQISTVKFGINYRFY